MSPSRVGTWSSMSSDRARLEELIRNESVMTPYSDIMAFADAIIRDGWRPQEGRTIDTVEELDTLPRGSVVKIGDSVHYKRTSSFFCWTSQDPHRAPSETIMGQGTPLLIHQGDTNV